VLVFGNEPAVSSPGDLRSFRGYRNNPREARVEGRVSAPTRRPRRPPLVAGLEPFRHRVECPGLGRDGPSTPSVNIPSSAPYIDDRPRSPRCR